MNQRKAGLAALLASACLATTAFASAPAVVSHVSAYKVDKSGHVEQIHGNVVRGEKVEYRATYTNLSHAFVRDLPATLIVPKGLFLVKAKGAAAVSFDGREFYRLAMTGSTPAAPETKTPYRYIRWNVPYLAPGRTQVVYAVFRVEK